MNAIFIVAARRGKPYGTDRFGELSLHPKGLVLAEVLDAQEVELRTDDDFDWFRIQMRQRDAEVVIVEAEALRNMTGATVVAIMAAKPKILIPLCDQPLIWPVAHLEVQILPAREPTAP